MKTHVMYAALGGACALIAAGQATAAVTVTQSASPAPTYSTTLNFDEAGGPTGSVAPNAFAGVGITSIVGGSGNLQVNNMTSSFAWLTNNTNVGYGNFGIHIYFAGDLTAWSAQVWDNGGNPGPFGGLYFNLLNDGVQVGSGAFSGPFGGLGNTWFNVTTTGGSVFDEIHFGGSAFGFPETMVDNMSWNAIPGPGALALMGVAGFVRGGRRRRA